MTAKDKYEAAAEKYFATNDPRHRLEGWALATALWWTNSTGGKRDGVSDAVHRFLHVCTEGRMTSWASRYVDDKEHCKWCGERYSVDNMSMCTNCFDGYCWRCVGERELHPNGNKKCSCGGELVG